MSSFAPRFAASVKSANIIMACIGLVTLLSSCSDAIKLFDSFRDKSKRASPQAQASINVGGATLTVDYGQPAKKGREIFGKLVPYGEVWRLGANEATEITLSKDVSVAGKPLKAGRYMLCAIPQPNSWTIIFNSKLGQWGAFFYDQKNDVLRVDVPASTSDNPAEQLALSFETSDNTANLLIQWDKVKVAVPFAIK
jgi:hypothetical protein